MINIKDGSVVIDDCYTLNSQLSFNEFANSTYYKRQNQEMMFSLDGLHKIGDRFFYVSLYFKENLLKRIHLSVEDDSIKGWEDEPNRKIIHDRLLRIIGISESADFVWGAVSSSYDPKGASSHIIILYNN
ncbi:MAG TPA: hypothetical protein DDW50_02475 [Firmicutes bacterium]|jgi:hypothetical protein|nr:hypothetical protein [Bacillota bacterium]